MTTQHWNSLPKFVRLIEGERGGRYYIRNGERVYVTESKAPKSTKYRAPKRGAYARFLANIKEI